MPPQLTLLKALLLKRHQQTHTVFRLEYEKVARSIDSRLTGGRALAVYNSADSSSDPALVSFAYACALAKSGEIEEACRIATTAIRDPNIAHNITVVVRAHEFDALLDHSGSATGD